MRGTKVQGHLYPGRSLHPEFPHQGPGCHCQAGGHEAFQGRPDGAGGRGRDADVLCLPAGASPAHLHEQPAGNDQQADPPADTGGRMLPGRPQCPDAGGGPAAAYRRNAMGSQAVYEHGPTQGNETTAAGKTGGHGRIDR